MLKYNIQLAHFEAEQIEDRGQIDRKGALDALKRFPFHEELAKLSGQQEGCLPTITFKDSSDNSMFAVWIDESNKFTLMCELGKRSLSLDQKFDSLDVLVEALGHFVDKNWEGIATSIGYKGTEFILFNPKVLLLAIVETLFIIVAAATYDLNLSAARFFITNPSTTELFVYQLIAVNIIAVIVMTALVTFDPKSRRLTGR